MSLTTTSISSISRVLAPVLSLAALLISSSNALALYGFLPVTGNNIGGNAATSQFTSLNGYGVINVSHVFSAGGAGPLDNQNSAIFPSEFTTLFPGSGSVQGHLGQTQYGSTSLVTFDLTGYTIAPLTKFGIWNTTDEVTQPAYTVELVDALNNVVPPTTFTYFGTQDNTGGAGVNGRHQLDMNLATGAITAGATINGGSGVHTNAVFWDIPTGLKQIRVYGNLAPLAGNNNQGDGVGYYFVENVVPEPSAIILGCIALLGGVTAMRRRS